MGAMCLNISRRCRPLSLLLAAWCLTWCGLAAAGPDISHSVFLEELTSVELRDKLAHGVTTILVPIGGTEQSGPHMVLGKHNVRVRALAGQIAQRLGNAVVAPVLAYVPEGAISPPQAHMRFAGTISIPPDTFENLLVAAGKSFKQHGFRDVVFLGDHGGYQKNEQRAAQQLNKEWAGDTRYRAYGLTAYYEAAQAPFSRELKARGFSEREIGNHAGLSDTALALAVDKSLVREGWLTPAAKIAAADGVDGDPRKASAELGQLGVRLIVDQSVQAIEAAIRQRGIR